MVRIWDGASWQDLLPAPAPVAGGRIIDVAEVDLDGHGPQQPELVAMVAPLRYSDGLLAAAGPDGTWRTLTGITARPDGGSEIVPFDPDGAGPLAPGVLYVADVAPGQWYISAVHFHGEWPGWEPLVFGELRFYPGPRIGLELWQRVSSEAVPELWMATADWVSWSTVIGMNLRERIGVFAGGGAAHGFNDAAVLQQDGRDEIVAATPNIIMRHDRGAWRAWADPNHSTRDILVHDPDGPGPADGQLYIVGSFTEVDGVGAGGAAVWAGGRWTPLGTEPRRYSDVAMADLGAGSRLYACGTAVGEAARAGVVVWNGDAWESIGIADQEVRTIIAHDPDGSGPAPDLLVAAGRFSSIGGVEAPRVAMYDGAAWIPADPEYTPLTWNLVSHDHDGAGPAPPALYAASSDDLFRLGTHGFEHVVAGEVRDLASFDPDGAGKSPAHLLAGLDAAAGGLARLDGDQWIEYEGGLQSIAGGAPEPGACRSVNAVTLSRDGRAISALAVTGYFFTAGSQPSSNFALWTDCPCYADCDGSGALDLFDFLCFQNRFAAADPGADCDGSGALDFLDFLCFQNAFAAGCP